MGLSPVCHLPQRRLLLLQPILPFQRRTSLLLWISEQLLQTSFMVLTDGAVVITQQQHH